MCRIVSQVGNFKVIANKYEDNSIELSLYNGADKVYSDSFFNATFDIALERALRHFDIYTVDFLKYNFIVKLDTLSENTYRIEDDYFCRIDDTVYFKHLTEPKDGWVEDKEGKRVIDR